jgi:hypothetical protein
MVCSTDSAPDRFEMDPIALYQQIPTPYAWFGIRPELFDAPCRDSRCDMTWQAHSFLCIAPDAVLTRRVQAIAGFSWGFAIDHQDSRSPGQQHSGRKPGTATSACSEPATPTGSSIADTSWPDRSA